MAKRQIQRLSVAILAADIAGYTRLMDEIRTARHPPEGWSRWIAYFIVPFGFGRTLDLLASEYVGEVIGSTDGVLWLLSILLFLGASASALQRKIMG